MISHDWNVSPREGLAIQEQLRGRVKTRWDRRRRVASVAGVDVSVKNGRARAAIVVVSFPELVPIVQATAESPVGFPYVPGLLSFRECPVVLAACEKLRRQPHLLLVDGQGIAHPRRLGLASHLGLLLNLPSIGCAKSRLTGAHDEPGETAGAASMLVDQGEIIGAALRTRDRTKVVYVSPGHLIDLAHAVEFVLACCTRFRLPEPIRLAHQAAGGRNVVA